MFDALFPPSCPLTLSLLHSLPVAVGDIEPTQTSLDTAPVYVVRSISKESVMCLQASQIWQVVNSFPILPFVDNLKSCRRHENEA